MAKQIGLYGGTFDPFHLGHLNMAIEIQEKKKLDEIWFCPARNSPHKHQEPTAPVEHRLKMIEKAIAAVPKMRVIDIESRREGPSYTIDTLKMLIQQYPNEQFHLILGTDAVQGFSQWRSPQEIVRLVPLIIGNRRCEPASNAHTEEPEIRVAIQQGYLQTSVMEISATEIRRRLRDGLFCGHLLPKEVLDYIKAFQLY